MSFHVWGAKIVTRIKDPPTGFGVRGRECNFLGVCPGVTAGILTVRDQGPGVRLIEVASTYVVADQVPAAPAPAGEGPAEDVFERAEVITCPACNGLHRPHTRDGTCRLGPPVPVPPVFPVAAEEEPPH